MGGLGPGGLCSQSWAALGTLCWRSWGALGAHVGGPRPSWDLCWRSWATLRAYVGGLVPLLELVLAVLGHLGA